MQIINVDLIPGKVMPILHASQFDKGRSLGVKLYNGGAVFELSGAEDLTAAVRKPDGNIVTETLTNAGGSLVEIITTEQMTACAGGSLCEIKIENAGDVIGTANFVLDVEEDPTNGGIESESEIDNLATQVAGLVASEVENQYDSANVIFDDEPTEGHGNGYTVKSEGIKRAVDNVQNAIDEVNDKADTNATAIGDLSTLTTSVTSSLVGAVNEVNTAISYKEYVVQIGTSLWNGVYYAETNVATDVLNYGKILSAIVIDESEQSDFSSRTNRPCFCQVIGTNVIRIYSPQASNASGHYVKYRVTFSANAVNRT